jgi:hypothetical protein
LGQKIRSKGSQFFFSFLISSKITQKKRKFQDPFPLIQPNHRITNTTHNQNRNKKYKEEEKSNREEKGRKVVFFFNFLFSRKVKI